LDQSTIPNAAECFLGNISDVAETVCDLLLGLSKITKTACVFFLEIFKRSSESRLHFSHTQLLSLILGTLSEPPPYEFWQLISIENPFTLVEGIKEGKAPIAFLGLIHYLIASNRIAFDRIVDSVTLPELDDTSSAALLKYIQNLEPSLESIFATVPANLSVISLVSAALYTALGFQNDKSAIKVDGLTSENALPFLALQLRFFRTIIKSDEWLDAFLVSGKSQLDSLIGIVQRLSDPIEPLDELCISTIFDVFFEYSPFVSTPAVAVNLLLLANACYRFETIVRSKTIARKFCESITHLQKLVDVQRSRVTAQIQGVLQHIGGNFISFLASHVDYFESNPLTLSLLFESRELASAVCTSYLSANVNVQTLRFFEKCFRVPPQPQIESPDALVSLYRASVSREDWESAAVIAGFLSSCERLSLIAPSPSELLAIIVNAKVDFGAEAPAYILELLQQQFADDATQANAVVHYVRELPAFPGFDLRGAWNSFRKYFRAKREVVARALASVLAPSVDPALQFVIRANPLPVDPPPASAYAFVELFADALIAQPTPKLFVFLRAAFVSYPFLFARLPDAKKVGILSACFAAFSGYEEYLLAKDQAKNRRQKFCEIHAAVLLLGILITDPAFADLFFATALDGLPSYTLSQLSYVLKVLLVFMAKSQLLAAAAAAYLIRENGLARIADAFLRLYDPDSRLARETVVVYNTFVQYAVEFFARLSDVDLVDLDEFVKADRPFSAFLSNGFLRSSLSLVPLQAFEAFNSAEESACALAMSNALLAAPDAEEEDTPAQFLRALVDAVRAAPADAAEPPPGVDPVKFRALDARQRALLLRRALPPLARVSPAMMRVILRQPAWVKVCVLQNLPLLLPPEHYGVLARVLRELAAVKDDTDFEALRRRFVDAVVPDPGYVRAVIAVLRAGPEKPVASRCLENLSELFAYPRARDRRAAADRRTCRGINSRADGVNGRHEGEVKVREGARSVFGGAARGVSTAEMEERATEYGAAR
jgi:hypothetical protein